MIQAEEIGGKVNNNQRYIEEENEVVTADSERDWD